MLTLKILFESLFWGGLQKRILGTETVERRSKREKLTSRYYSNHCFVGPSR